MAKVCAFALFSTRRQDEICRITWADYQADETRALVRDMKNPGRKKKETTHGLSVSNSATPKTKKQVTGGTARSHSAGRSLDRQCSGPSCPKSGSRLTCPTTEKKRT
jgi:hypothetical protein